MLHPVHRLLNALAIAVLSLSLAGLLCNCTKYKKDYSDNSAAPAEGEGSPLVRPVPSSSEIVELNADNADEEMLQSPLPVVVVMCNHERYACQVEQPILEKLAVEYRGRVKFAHVELDGGPLARAIGDVPLAALPAHLAVNDGEKMAAYPGVMGEAELRKWITDAFSNPPSHDDPHREDHSISL